MGDSHGIPAPPLISAVRYGELAVGDRWGAFPEILTAELCDRLRGAMGTQRSGDHAPPGVLSVLSLWALRRAMWGIPAGGVLTRQRFTTWTPLSADGAVEVEVRLVAQRRARGGLHSTFLFSVVAEGRLAATVEWTILAPPEPVDP